MVMQIKRRVGSAGAPTTLAEGQLAYTDPGTVAFDGLPVADDHLYIGSEDSTNTAVIRTLVGSDRQVELAGTQTITGPKTIAVGNLHITGGAANNILQTNGAGVLTWTSAPSGGLLNVETDGVTIGGDGTTGNELEVLSVPPHDISISTRAMQPDGSITTIAITPATYDATADGIMTNFAITRLDDGTF